ncbi:class I SAM-dependent methyltransferase [Candidatus Daviesbacteria bacterium]|nr:class I SAM-dependent methyltransferase [Candidatus Daviesbacteria bacterium]
MRNQKAEKLRDNNYYTLAHKGSLDLNHPSMKKLLKLCEDSNFILDMGCGEGTRINLILATINTSPQAYGIDVNKLAIEKARKQYPKINFTKGNLEKLPFKDNFFDLVYSAYVFEHLMNPETVMEEARRVLKPKGMLVIIAPNFGSPNRRSPNSKEKKINKLIKGFLSDLINLNKKNISNLNWTKVEPRSEIYTIDSDTTTEPYLNTLILYTKQNFKINYFSSFWDQDRLSLFQLVFKILGLLKIYPFYLWGPHLMVVLEKNEKYVPSL